MASGGRNVARNEKQEKLFQQWKEDVLNMLIASKTGIDTKKMQMDLEECCGKVPVEAMGFSSYGEFLYELRDIMIVGHFYGENPSSLRTRLFLFLNGRAVNGVNSDVAEIARLVQGQEKPKVKKRRDGTTNAPTLHQVKTCDARYLRGKTEFTGPSTSGPPPRYNGTGGGKFPPRPRNGTRQGGLPSHLKKAYPPTTSSYRPNGLSNSYRSNSRPTSSPPSRAPRAFNLLPSGFDDDGDDSADDDRFDYYGGVSTVKPVPESSKSHWINSVPSLMGTDCVDNRIPVAVINKPKFKFQAPETPVVDPPTPTQRDLTPTPKPVAINTSTASSKSRRFEFQKEVQPDTPAVPVTVATPRVVVHLQEIQTKPTAGRGFPLVSKPTTNHVANEIPKSSTKPALHMNGVIKDDRFFQACQAPLVDSKQESLTDSTGKENVDKEQANETSYYKPKLDVIRPMWQHRINPFNFPEQVRRVNMADIEPRGRGQAVSLSSTHSIVSVKIRRTPLPSSIQDTSRDRPIEQITRLNFDNLPSRPPFGRGRGIIPRDSSDSDSLESTVSLADRMQDLRVNEPTRPRRLNLALIN